LVFITENAIESVNVRNEINYALKKGKPFLAVHLRDVELPGGLELQMGSKQALLKWRMTSDGYWRKLEKALPGELIEEHAPRGADSAVVHGVFISHANQDEHIASEIARPLLDGRRKPRPVVGELWIQSKAEVSLVTTLIARAFAQGQPAPFDEVLEDVLPRLENVTLVPNTIQVIGSDVIFSVQALNNYSQPVALWVRTRVDKALAERTIEKRLFEDLALVRASSDTIATFWTDQAVIVATTLGG
jgi:hypothetical protein